LRSRCATPFTCAASSAGDRAQDRQRLIESQRTVAREVLIERLALEPLHHVVLAPVGQLTEREDVDDVAMADLVDRLRLGLEARHHLLVGRVLARQHLDRDALADDRLQGEVHRAEPTPAEHFLDLVLADREPRCEILIGTAVTRRRVADRRRRVTGDRLVGAEVLGPGRPGVLVPHEARS
jgi:hypothetical protein